MQTNAFRARFCAAYKYITVHYLLICQTIVVSIILLIFQQWLFSKNNMNTNQTDNFQYHQIEIQKYIKEQTRDFYSIKSQSDWTGLKKTYKEKATDFSEFDLKVLSDIALNSEVTINERTLAIYFLNLSEKKSGGLLEKIFLSPMSGTQDKYKYSLKTMALEGLELQEGYDFIPSLSEVSDPYLRKMLTIVKQGQNSRRHLLHDFLEKIRDAKMPEQISEK